jgi:hypothetical protein
VFIDTGRRADRKFERLPTQAKNQILKHDRYMQRKRKEKIEWLEFDLLQPFPEVKNTGYFFGATASI